jgi:hypothetical protein
MKITIKLIGMQELPRGFEEDKESSVDFSGNSIIDLIHQLFSRMDPANNRIFLPGRDEISPDLYAVVNGIMTSGSNRLDLRLTEGDTVHLIMAPG